MKQNHRRANFAFSAFAALLLLAGPALAIGAAKNGNAPREISGAGLVLVVSLQRM